MARVISAGDGPTAMVRMGIAALRETEPTRPTVLLGVGDVLAVVLVLAAGMLRHNVDPLQSPDHATMVIGPFLLGWIVGAPLVGAYSGGTLTSPRAVLATGTNAWFIAALVGLVLRATAWFPGGVTGLFGVVVTGFGLLAVGGWRILSGILFAR
ncbi:DUF3054 domain-containing protein [Halobacteriales archaeon QS_1_68_20]|nr:MAG: DUF3054 domain-containing protein [Halobacteriales archaeon QS_1_68_20]